MAKKILTLAEMYRLYGRANIKVCTNGAVYRRNKESNSWDYQFTSDEAKALLGGAA